jgi:TraB/PrgY/gumN family
MKQLINKVILINVLMINTLFIFAQKGILANSKLWKIWGNGLKDTSYILLTNFTCTEKTKFEKNVLVAMQSVKCIALEADFSNKDSAQKVKSFSTLVVDSQRIKNILKNTQYQEYVKKFKDEGATNQDIDQVNGIKVEDIYNMSTFQLLPCEPTVKPKQTQEEIKVFAIKNKITLIGLQSIDQYFFENQIHNKTYWGENIWYAFKNELDAKEAIKNKIALFNSNKILELQTLFISNKYYQLKWGDTLLKNHVDYLTNKIEEQLKKTNTFFQIDVSNVLINNISVFENLSKRGYTIISDK